MLNYDEGMWPELKEQFNLIAQNVMMLWSVSLQLQ